MLWIPPNSPSPPYFLRPENAIFFEIFKPVKDTTTANRNKIRDFWGSQNRIG